MGRRKFYNSDFYKEWNEVRIKATIDHYGKDFFKGKTILDLGCGWGDVSAYFAKECGAYVTGIDVRPPHIEKAKNRHPHPNLQFFTKDIEKRSWDYGSEKFDIIICWGLLYHLKDPKRVLKKLCKHCNYLIVDSEVIDSEDARLTKEIAEPSDMKHGWGGSILGFGMRPSAALIEHVFKEARMQVESPKDLTQLDHSCHNYSWTAKNNDSWQPGQRRFYFVSKKTRSTYTSKRDAATTSTSKYLSSTSKTSSSSSSSSTKSSTSSTSSAPSTSTSRLGPITPSTPVKNPQRISKNVDADYAEPPSKPIKKPQRLSKNVKDANGARPVV